MQKDRYKIDTAQAWKAANFTGAAVHGCLKDLSEYTGENTKTAPKISYEEFDRRLAEIEGGVVNGDV